MLHWRNFATPAQWFHISGYTIRSHPENGLHTHDFAELFWVETGEGWQDFPDGAQPLRKGALCFVEPAVVHRFRSAGMMRIVNVAFPGKLYRDFVKRHFGGGANPWSLLGGEPRLHLLQDSGLDQLNRMASEMFHASRTLLLVERFLLNLLYMLGRGSSDDVPAGTPGWLKEACSRIREPQYVREGIPAFVRLAGRSPEHVARAARQWLGKSPRELVQEARMWMAARALAMTDTPIVVVAEECGFENLGHFYTVFRAHHGCSPGRYRLRQLHAFNAG